MTKLALEQLISQGITTRCDYNQLVNQGPAAYGSMYSPKSTPESIALANQCFLPQKVK